MGHTGATGCISLAVR